MFPNYLPTWLKLGYPCKKDLESIGLSQKMFSLVKIEKLSPWILNDSYDPSLKKNAINLIAAGIFAWKASQEGDLVSSSGPPLFAPEVSETVQERVVEKKAILVRNCPNSSSSMPGQLSKSKRGSAKSISPKADKGPHGKSLGAHSFTSSGHYRYRRPIALQ